MIMTSLIKDFELFQSMTDTFMIVLLPLIITFLIAAYIGLERQNVGKAAGVSAHVLVALGAAGVAILQRVIYDTQVAMSINGVNIDPESQRLIAQVISGVGFIGAGVILKDTQQIIRGITTAATMWGVAIMGLIIGSGYIFIGTTLGLVMAMFMTIRDIKRGINPFVRQHDPNEREDHSDDA